MTKFTPGAVASTLLLALSANTDALGPGAASSKNQGGDRSLRGRSGASSRRTGGDVGRPVAERRHRPRVELEPRHPDREADSRDTEVLSAFGRGGVHPDVQHQPQLQQLDEPAHQPARRREGGRPDHQPAVHLQRLAREAHAVDGGPPERQLQQQPQRDEQRVLGAESQLQLDGQPELPAAPAGGVQDRQSTRRPADPADPDPDYGSPGAEPGRQHHQPGAAGVLGAALRRSSRSRSSAATWRRLNSS